ncbi:MAG: hypothetical protein ACRCX5_14375 [Bacteroidales bacterium]
MISLKLIFDIALILLCALTYSGLLFGKESGVFKLKIKNIFKFLAFLFFIFLNVLLYCLYGIDQYKEGYKDAMEDTNLKLEEARKRADRTLQMCDSVDMFNEQLIK